MNETVKDLVAEEVECEAVEAVVETGKTGIGFWKGALIFTGIITGTILVIKGVKYVVKKVKGKKVVEQVKCETEGSTEGTNE